MTDQTEPSSLQTTQGQQVSEDSGGDVAEQLPELVEIRPFPWKISLFIVSSAAIYIAVASYLLPSDSTASKASNVSVPRAEARVLPAVESQVVVTDDLQSRMQRADKLIMQRLAEKRERHEHQLYEHQLNQNQFVIDSDDYVNGHHEQLVRAINSASLEAAPLMEDLFQKLDDPDLAPMIPGGAVGDQAELAEIHSKPVISHPAAKSVSPRF